MRRRDFIKVIAGSAGTWPLAALAQQPAKLPTIGFLRADSPESNTHLVAAFRQGLKETGFVEGQNVMIEYRWAEGHYDRLSGLAAELVRRRVAVIVATPAPAALAAKAATATVPIVFSSGIDPIKAGLVASFNRPGGNATGMYVITAALQAKRLELLRELVPKGGAIGILVNDSGPAAEPEVTEIEAAARTIKQEIYVLNANNEREIDTAFAMLVQQRAGALLVGAGSYFQSQRKQIVELAARYAVPAMYPWGEYAKAGGLMSYATSLAGIYRQVGIYTGRILKGAKPADLPVVQPTKF